MLPSTDSPVLVGTKCGRMIKQRNDHRDERDAVQRKTPGRANRQRQRTQHRPDHARQIELNRIKGDGVRQIFRLHQRRNERLVGRPAEGLRGAHNKRKGKNMPHVDHAGGKQCRQKECARHLYYLRTEQQLLTLRCGPQTRRLPAKTERSVWCRERSRVLAVKMNWKAGKQASSAPVPAFGCRLGKCRPRST